MVGAVKWRRVVDTDVLGDLLGQQAALGAQVRRAKLMIFSREGAIEQMIERARGEGVQLFTAVDLYER